MFCDGGGRRDALGDLTVQRIGGLFSKKEKLLEIQREAILLGQMQVS